MNKWTAFIFFVTGQHIFPEAINESVKQELLLALKNFMEVGSLYPGYLSNVDEIKRAYSEKLEDGYRVLAISHSQGGLFMNDAYQRVVTSRKEKYLAGHQIATPVNQVVMNHFGYSTHSKDLVIDFVLSFIGALGPNMYTPWFINNFLSGDYLDMILNHGISSTYLFDSSLREQVKKGIISTAHKLESNCLEPKFTYKVAEENSLKILFDASESMPKDSNLKFSWNFGEIGTGEDLTSMKPTFTYSSPGTYSVTLTVTDEYNDTKEISQDIEVRSPEISFFLKINPKGSYIFVDTIGGYQENGKFIRDVKVAPTAFNLLTYYADPTVNLRPGDKISLEAMGAILPGPGWSDSEKGMAAVFRDANRNFLYPGLDGDFFNIETPPTYPRELPTDIPQDFWIPSDSATHIQIPMGATEILFAVPDNYYNDNFDPNGDYGVLIKITILRSNLLD